MALENIRNLYAIEKEADEKGLKAENAIRPFVVGRKNWLFEGAICIST